MTLPEWLRRLLLRRVERVISTRDRDFAVWRGGKAQLERWYIVRRTIGNIYIHRFNRDDDDRALHDHPWLSVSLVLAGGYLERLTDSSAWRPVGSVVFRRASAAHRIEIGDAPAITLFFTGPKLREWGFLCPQGWVHWRDFVDESDTGKIGVGCGEP